MESHDYVLIGAGSAGRLVAARLSEHPDHHVLLLEAGTATAPEASHVPARLQEVVGSEHDWAYTTVAQAGTFGTVHRWPRGKLLGGTSAMKGMAFARGDRSVFDGWERAGATGWSYERLLPYFTRSERRDGLDSAFHGSKGPLRVAPVPTRHPLSEAFHAAVLAVGYPATEDIDGADQYGVGWYGVNIVDGRRQSVADAYLRPHLDRPGLTVVADALALRLLLDGDRCAGVEYRVGSEVRRAYAEREVVVCAGVIGSPHLLMVSGIGPGEHLRQVGVPVVVELPGVGENLHDHLQSGIVYAVDEPIRLGENNHTELTALLRYPVPPGRDLRHRRRRGPTAAGPRGARATRGRRLGDPVDPVHEPPTPQWSPSPNARPRCSPRTRAQRPPDNPSTRVPLRANSLGLHYQLLK